MPTPAARDLDAFLPGLAAGDPDAFVAWVAGAEPVLRGALRAFAAAVDVEAVLQETLLRVWQLAPSFVADGRPDALLRFAHRISRNLALDECRRRRVTPDEAALAGAVDPRGAELPDPLLRRALADCRERLPKKPAAALAQRLASEGAEPDAALAAKLGMTTNTFLQNFGRARKLLAECLEKRGVELAAYVGAGAGGAR